MRKEKNSKKIFGLQIKEREQVSENEKRFNVVKTKKDPQYFQRICEDTLFFSTNGQFRPKLPHLTLYLKIYPSSSPSSRDVGSISNLEGHDTSRALFS